MLCCRWLMVVGIVAVANSSAWAGPPLRSKDGVSDVLHTIKARKLLAEDPLLGPWNLGVIVTDRVALLWGPAPSAEVAFKAEERLRQMVEVVEVQNKLFVSESVEAVRATPKNDAAPTVRPDPLLPALPLDPALGADASGARNEPARSTSRQDKAGPQIQVLPPEALSDAVGRRLPAGESASGELEKAIRTLLQSKPAFIRVEFTIQGTRVYLQTRDLDADVLNEAARAIARLPNVEGVTLANKPASR